MENNQKMLRKVKRQARQSLSVEEKIQKSQKITETLIQLDSYQKAQRVGCYLNLPEEVDVSGVIQAAWAMGKQVYLPVVIAWGQPLQFAPYTPKTTLTKDSLGIDIPAVAEHEYIDASELDMVVTPLVVFDQQRNRIGMGGGFYDRTFAFKSQQPKQSKQQPILIGVAFEAQRTDDMISANDWDICPDSIVSERAIY